MSNYRIVMYVLPAGMPLPRAAYPRDPLWDDVQSGCIDTTLENVERNATELAKSVASGFLYRKASESKAGEA